MPKSSKATCAGRLHLALQPLNLVELVGRMAATFRAALEARQVELELNLPQEPILVRAGPDRLAQVIGNLLSNALEHTPAGGKRLPWKLPRMPARPTCGCWAAALVSPKRP